MNDYSNLIDFYSKRLYQYLSLSLAQDFFKERGALMRWGSVVDPSK